MVGSRVYVGGLPFGVRDRDLEKFFKGFGRIRDILIKNGYGFVVSKNKVLTLGNKIILILIFLFYFMTSYALWTYPGHRSHSE